MTLAISMFNNMFLHIKMKNYYALSKLMRKTSFAGWPQLAKIMIFDNYDKYDRRFLLETSSSPGHIGLIPIPRLVSPDYYIKLHIVYSVNVAT